MYNQVRYHAPWHQLHSVIVGRCYGEQFFQPIGNARIRESLQQIARETEEDYSNIVKILTDLDISVVRPHIDHNITIMDFVDQQGTLDYRTAKSATLVPRPPMQPRDSVLVVGNTVLGTNQDIDWFSDLIHSDDIVTMPPEMQFDAPLVTPVGDTLIVDCSEQPGLANLVKQQFPSYKVHAVYHGGHNDAVFCLPKPGLIVGTYHADNYEQTFPNWTVYHLENQSWDAVPAWRSIKHSNKNKWWVPEAVTNAEFENFVNTWLTDWTGYVQETVFDVNMLSVNANTILVNNYNKELFGFFRQHNIQPIIANFRHRFFWDGGIHCVTSDLYRQGECESYVRS